MEANPIVVIDHGRGEIPEELQSDPRFRDGSRLQLVPVPEVSKKENLEQEFGKWEQVAGILANSDYDPNTELEREKQKELGDEARWLRS